MCLVSETSKKINCFDLERPEFEDRPIPGPRQRVWESEAWIRYADEPEFLALVTEIAAAYQAHHISEELPGRLPATVRLLEPFIRIDSVSLLSAQHQLWRMAEKFGIRWASFRHPVYGVLVFFNYPSRCRFYKNLVLLPDLMKPFRKRQAA